MATNSDTYTPLSIKAADVGYSKEGIDDLKAKITNYTKNIQAKTSTSSDEFRKMIKAIAEGWNGTDRDIFIGDLIKAVNILSKSCDDLKGKLNSSLENYKAQFESMQKQTYDGITINRTVQ